MERHTDDERALIETFRAAGGERVVRFRRGRPQLPKAAAEALARLVRGGRVRRHATLGGGCVSYRLREFGGEGPSPDSPDAIPPTAERRMTEAEWLDATDLTPMLEIVKGRASDRKWRLFNCACCRRVWHLMSDHPGRSAVETAERYLDGGCGPVELAAAHDAAVEFITELWAGDTDRLLSPTLNAVQAAAFAVRERAEPHGVDEGYGGSHSYALNALGTDLQTDSPERVAVRLAPGYLRQPLPSHRARCQLANRNCRRPGRRHRLRPGVRPDADPGRRARRSGVRRRRHPDPLPR